MRRFFVLCTLPLLLGGCISWNHGLKPLEPSYSVGWSSSVPTLTPTFRWAAYPLREGEEHLRYHFQLVRERTIVLQRDDLPEPVFTVPSPLEPATSYTWSVRPIWQSGTQTRWGEWNGKHYFYLTPILIGWGGMHYAIATPAVPPATTTAGQP